MKFFITDDTATYIWNSDNRLVKVEKSMVGCNFVQAFCQILLKPEKAFRLRGYIKNLKFVL